MTERTRIALRRAVALLALGALVIVATTWFVGLTLAAYAARDYFGVP